MVTTLSQLPDNLLSADSLYLEYWNCTGTLEMYTRAIYLEGQTSWAVSAQLPQVDFPCGAGVLHQIVSTQVQHARLFFTQSDLKFCENEGSKRFKITEKGGQ